MIGKYRVLGLAGQGSFGKVHKTIKEDEKKLYAIKEVTKSNLTEAVFENLIREVQISKQLKHPNLSQCIVTMESKQSFYIVFEYCEGGDLGNYLKQVKKLSFGQAMDIIRQMKEGYKYLFQQNILHRDLKLDNILVANKQHMQIKISDFGCSKNSILGSTVIGTPKYMAPEVLNENEKYNYKADFWSFALCCWELLYGFNNYPFSLESKKALMADIKNYSAENLRFPTHPKFPDEVRTFFIRCLHISPQLRIDAEDFFSHPFFNLDGSSGVECEEGQTDEQSVATTNVFKKTKLSAENGQIIMFTEIKKSYNEKILEIRLCKNTAKDTFQYWDPKANKEFESNLLVMSVILTQRAKQKTDACLMSLEDKKNVYNLSGFEDFIEIPNEYLNFKTEILQLQEEIKKLDNEVYECFTGNCYSQEFREKVNDVLFRSTSPEAKKTLMSNVIKYVQNNFKNVITEYDMASFPLNLKRVVYIMKGKILENLKEFI